MQKLYQAKCEIEFNKANYADNINTPTDEQDYKSNKIPEGLTVEQLQQQRDSELHKITGGKPQMKF